MFRLTIQHTLLNEFCRYPVCVPTFSRINNTQARGGEAQGSITDTDSCLERCVQNTACVAVDLNFNQNAVLCWFHLESTNLDNTQAASNIYHYVVQERCGGEKHFVDLFCCCQHSLGGVA